MKNIQKIVLGAIIGLIRFYQAAISPGLGSHCRFYPSCSEYLCDSLRKRGIIKGMGKGIARFVRCHPFHPGGYDPA